MDAIAKDHPRRLPGLGAYLALAVAVLSIVLTAMLTLVIERTASEGVATSIGSNLEEWAAQTATRLDRGMFERYREIQLMSARLSRLTVYGLTMRLGVLDVGSNTVHLLVVDAGRLAAAVVRPGAGRRAPGRCA